MKIERKVEFELEDNEFQKLADGFSQLYAVKDFVNKNKKELNNSGYDVEQMMEYLNNAIIALQNVFYFVIDEDPNEIL